MRDPAPRPEAEARQLGVAERETVRGGVSGVVVDPDDPVSTVSGIHDALVQENGPPGVWTTLRVWGPSGAGTPSWTKSSFGTTRRLP